MGENQSGESESVSDARMLEQLETLTTFVGVNTATHEEKSNGEDSTGWLAVVTGFPFRRCVDGKLLIEVFSN
jgi:hypothetical protein